MKGRYAASWKLPRRGLTLVEAIAGTAILGTLLVSVLLAGSRLTVQGHRAEKRVEACRIADELLSTWWPRINSIDHDSGGQVPGHEGWLWRTQTVENENASKLSARIVALEVFAPGEAEDAPAARVEILVAAKE